MKRVNRVRKHEEFTSIIHQNTPIRGSYTNVYCSKKPEGCLRIGISVGKRNGGAVTRVRIKRQIRAICGEALMIDAPYDIVIVVKPEYEPKLQPALKKELLAAFQNLGAQH